MEDSPSGNNFDLCIIGSGAGNTIVDEAFNNYRVAIVDAGRFGGTCLNAGCIPTKMMVLPADYAASPSQASRVGVDLQLNRVNFPAITDRIFSRTDAISAGGLEYRKNLENVTVYPQLAEFKDPHTLKVGLNQISAKHFIIAAGSRPKMPDIPGIDDPDLANYIHTSDTIMRIDKLPKRLIIVGGGYVAVEFAHIFASYGTNVTLINRSGSLLRKEDKDISAAFTELFSSKVMLRLNQRPIQVEAGYRGGICLRTADGFNWEYNYDADMILFATGRTPNTDTLNLAAAGVDCDSQTGLISVDDHQLTSASHIYAIGDVANRFGLRHVANHEARVARHNILADLTGSDSAAGATKVSSNHDAVPHAVFSDPQVASVGKTEQELQAAGQKYLSYTQKYADTAYGWALGDQPGLCKVLADPDTGQLLGCHIIGPQASTLIQPAIQAMSFGLAVSDMARGQYWIHPALTEVLENALLGLGLN